MPYLLMPRVAVCHALCRAGIPSVRPGRVPGARPGRSGAWCGKRERVGPKYPSRYAKSNDSTTWRTFEQAMRTYNRGRVSGIGLVLVTDDDLIVLDLDHFSPDSLSQGVAQAVFRQDRTVSMHDDTQHRTRERALKTVVPCKRYRGFESPPLRFEKPGLTCRNPVHEAGFSCHSGEFGGNSVANASPDNGPQRTR
jgi:hypothetical protein